MSRGITLIISQKEKKHYQTDYKELKYSTILHQ